MTDFISSLVKSDKDNSKYKDINQRFALELITKGVVAKGTEKEILDKIDLKHIKEVIVSSINGHNTYGVFSISEDKFDQLRDVYFARASEKDKSEIFRCAIESSSKGEKNKAVVVDMALHGYKLDKNDIYTFNTNAYSNVSRLGKEILNNKSLFSSSATDLTDNDAKRVALLSSALANGYFKNEEEQAKYVKTHRGVSPLKLAIDTKQFDLAIKMIKEGEILKPEELSIGMRFKNAIGILNKDDIKKFSQAKLDAAQKNIPGENKFKSMIIRERDGMAASSGVVK